MFNVIGICGRAGSGKDTAAAMITHEWGHVRYSLADPIKRGIESMFNLRPSIWEPETKEREIRWLGKSPRQLAQTLGTEWGRAMVAEDVWLRCADQFLHSHQTVVIPDIRFINEVHWIRSKGGIVLRVFRPDTSAVFPHASEKQLPEWMMDGIILNDSTLPEFRERVIRCVEDLHQAFQTEYSA